MREEMGCMWVQILSGNTDQCEDLSFDHEPERQLLEGFEQDSDMI